jgi:hypothetical protein
MIRRDLGALPSSRFCAVVLIVRRVAKGGGPERVSRPSLTSSRSAGSASAEDLRHAWASFRVVPVRGFPGNRRGLAPGGACVCSRSAPIGGG